MQNWIKNIVKFPKTTVFLTVIATFFFLFQLKSLKVIIDPDSTLPQTHPYISVGNLIEKTFGNKFTVLIGVHSKNGDIFNTATLEKVSRITQKLQLSPAVIKTNLLSLSARKAKNISGNSEGMVVKPLMEYAPKTPAEMNVLKTALDSNPVYANLLISKDYKTTQIVAEFRKVEGGFTTIKNIVEEIVTPERDGSVDIEVSGQPIFLAELEKYSQRMGFLFPIALLIIGLIHYEAFRTLQALFLPLVTALLSVIWAMGALGLLGEPFDVFNASTPILILAIAAGHAVQILKRFYEEYSKLVAKRPGDSRKEIAKQAVIESLTKVGPVMIVACSVAAIGFFSLMIFEIKSIRTFGIFTGSGVLSALILELTFIPALRVLLPAPGDHEIARESQLTIWDKITDKLYELSMFRRKSVYLVVTALVVILSIGGFWIKIDNSQKGYFYGKTSLRVADDALNSRMAGTNATYLLIEGQSEDAIKRPDVLIGIEKIQRFIEKADPSVGKTISIVDFLKQMNRSMNADKADFYKIPDSKELVAQYLLLYSNSGEPGDFDSYVDNDYRSSVITTFMKSDSSHALTEMIVKVLQYAKEVLPQDISVRAGGGTLGGVALNEIMIHEKVLNILQIMGAVFLISSLVFRSFLAGILILVPLVAAVFVNFGVMGLLGIPLQIATALVSAMAVGIGADYGIYMSYRMREELRTHTDETLAIKKAFRSAGKAALFVSTAVAGGFGVLMLSWGFMIHLWMGFLIAIAMLVSSITALTLFPALIFSLKPNFIFENRKANTMKKTQIATTSLLALITIVTLSSNLSYAENLTASEIARKSFESNKVTDSTSDSRFRLINNKGQERVRETHGATKLVPNTQDNQRLVTFDSPADVKGTKTLMIEHSKSDDDLWIFLPAMKKVRRLVASNKRDSFVGTDFSYGDVIGHKVEDWNHKLIKDDKVDGKECYQIESLPARPEVATNSGYSKRVGCIDKESFIAIKGEAYDLNGQLLKRFAARDIKKVDPKNNKWQAMVLESENVQTEHKTILEFTNFKANVGIGNDLFTSRSLEK